MHDLSCIYHIKQFYFFFSFLQRYNLLCSNTTLLNGLSIEHITTIKNKLNFKRDESHRSYRRYSAERKPEIQAYIVKLPFKTSAIPVHSSTCWARKSTAGSWFSCTHISEKTSGKMQKYGMRWGWRRERKEVEVNFTDSLYEDSCFYPLGKPLLFFRFKWRPTSLSSSQADTLVLLTTSQKREQFPGLRSPWWRFSNPVWRMHTPPKPWPSKRNQSIPSPLSFPCDVHQRIPLTAQITGCWTHLTKKDQWVNSGLNNSITLPVFRHP